MRAPFFVGDGYRAAPHGEPRSSSAPRAAPGACRAAPIGPSIALRRPLAAGDAIERVVVEGARSRPWASGFRDALPVATHAQETVALKRELRRLARALGGDWPRSGTLSARILDAVG